MDLAITSRASEQMTKNLLACLRKNVFYTGFCLVDRPLYSTGQIPLTRAACKAIGTGLNTFLTAGFSTSTLAGGDQFINDNFYDLAKSEDFLGVNLQPFIGINSQYNIARNLKLTLGYNFSKAFHLFNNSEEKISYNTHQIKVGFLVSLYR